MAFITSTYFALPLEGDYPYACTVPVYANGNNNVPVGFFTVVADKLCISSRNGIPYLFLEAQEYYTPYNPLHTTIDAGINRTGPELDTHTTPTVSDLHNIIRRIQVSQDQITSAVLKIINDMDADILKITNIKDPNNGYVEIYTSNGRMYTFNGPYINSMLRSLVSGSAQILPDGDHGKLAIAALYKMMYDQAKNHENTVAKLQELVKLPPGLRRDYGPVRQRSST